MALSLLRPLKRRDPDEHHRVSTALELLVDLASVIAIASAAAGLHHALAENHAAEGIASFAMAFFGIWWAWMNYTWFASAHDDGSVNFRFTTFVFIAGALIMAAGIDEFYTVHDQTKIVTGFIIMRVAMIWLWLCVAAADAKPRKTALRYAAGITVNQTYWCLLLVMSSNSPAFLAFYVLGALAELAVPYWAEKAGMTPWHRHHVIERYGLLNIIVLGESLLAIALAIRAISGRAGFDTSLFQLVVCALLITFSMWWLYFTEDEHLGSREHNRAFSWGYGHVLIFAGGAATGAGFAVVAEILTHHAKASPFAGNMSVAVPVAVYLFGLWLVRDRHLLAGWRFWLLPAASALIVASPLFPASVAVTAAIAVIAAALRGRKAN